MSLTTPIVLTQTHGIVLVLLNRTRTRRPSVTRMRDFLSSKLGFDKFSIVGCPIIYLWVSEVINGTAMCNM